MTIVMNTCIYICDHIKFLEIRLKVLAVQVIHLRRQSVMLILPRFPHDKVTQIHRNLIANKLLSFAQNYLLC